jgi:flagellar biosynthesis GTPase FlhF
MFNFMETFFFISLGITFILILLLVYHFKQRILAVEQKGDTLFEIINNLIMETSSLKQYVRSLPMFFNRGGSMEPPQNTVMGPQNTPFQMHQHRPLQENEEDDEEEDDEEEDDEEEDDEEDEEDEDDEEEEDDEPNAKIVVSDDEYGSNIEMEINEMTEMNEFLSDMKTNEEHEKEVGELNLEELELLDEEDVGEVETEEVELKEEVEVESEIKVEEVELDEEQENSPSLDQEDASNKTVDLGIVPDYRKMSLPELKAAVLAKSLAQDVSKMKKNQLLQLLGN